MAGHRLAKARTTADRTGQEVREVLRPKQLHLRAQRRLAALTARLDEAKTPGDRISAAADYVRGALKQVDPAAAETTATELVDLLTKRGNDLLAHRRDH